MVVLVFTLLRKSKEKGEEMFDRYRIDVSKAKSKKITPKLIEQTRRFLTRTISTFCHNDMESKSGEEFEQWHEDKAVELLALIFMPEKNRAKATEMLSISSCSQRRLDAAK